ncbi:MAG TPA: TonB-dependent receptor [Gemmatimonadales bacterium]
MTALLALLTLLGSPADTLRGRVTDTTGAPLPGVGVSIAELDRGARSDASGAFAFAHVPPGRYTVVARMVGFAPRTASVTVPEAAPLVLALRPAAFELPAVVVTATRSPSDPLASPLATSTLGAERPAKQDISLAHALASVPGVRVVSTGGEMGKPMIRGLTGSRVLTLDAGNRLEDYSWSDEDGPSVDAAFADRVEVIRGPVSVLYGSDALGGVVNAVPAPVPEADSGPGFVRGGSDLYFASNNAELGVLVRLEGVGGGTGWRANLAGRRSEALHTPAGEIDNTGFLALDGDAAVGVRGDWGRGTLRLVHYGGEFHLHEAGDTVPPVPGSPEHGPVRKLSDDRLQASAQLPLGAIQLEVKSQVQRHSLAEVVEGDTASTEKGFDLLLTTGTLDVLAHHALGSHTRGTFGVSGFAQHNATRGAEPLVPGAAARGVGTFAFEQADVGRWSLLGGARVDLRRLDADSNTDLALSAQRRDYQAWSGDVGLAFRPAEDMAITANLGRAWRAPTLFELFANGPHVGESRFEKGDTALVPEAGLTGDLSFRWRGPRFQGELSVYASSYQNYIYITPTGGVQDSLPVYAYRQGDATQAGAEGRIEALVVRDVSVRARADFVNGTLKHGGPLPLVPPLVGDVGIDWRLSELWWATRASLSVDAELAARQNRIAAYDVPTAGYGLLHFSGTLEKPIGGRAVRVELAVHNALNTPYKNFLSRYKRFALDPGRNIVVRVGTDF